MSTLALTVALLLVLVSVYVVGTLGYLVHRHPGLAMPLTVSLTGAAVLAACFVPIAVR